MNKIKLTISKIYSFILPFIGAFLGALGGSEDGNKMFRRIMFPLAIASLAYIKTESVLVLTVLFMIIPLSMGYGIPSSDDSGSGIGRFFYSLFNQNQLLTNIFTRGIIGLLIGLSLVSVPIIKNNWRIYLICFLGIVLTQALISWQNFGIFILFNKKLSWVETTVYFLITLFATLIIKIK